MITSFTDAVVRSKDAIMAGYKARKPEDYTDLVRSLIPFLGGDGDQGADPNRITVINHGSYHGTIVFVIGEMGYQPSRYWVTAVDYGSCSHCDALEHAGLLENGQYEAYYNLALHLAQKMRVVQDWGDEADGDDLGDFRANRLEQTGCRRRPNGRVAQHGSELRHEPRHGLGHRGGSCGLQGGPKGVTPKHRIIVADCPWEYDNYGMAKHGAARSAYDLMGFDALAAIPVAQWAWSNAACLLWATGPQGADGVPQRLLSAWGYRPVTKIFTWVKVNDKCRACEHPWASHKPSPPETPGLCAECTSRLRPTQGWPCAFFVPKIYFGTGNYTGGGTEDVWLGIRGEGLASARLTKDVRHTILAPRGAHSAKPEEMQDRVEKLWPGAYLELFARRQRPGWTCWGLELGQRLSAAGVTSSLGTPYEPGDGIDRAGLFGAAL